MIQKIDSKICLDSQPIENNREILNWLVKHISESYKSNKTSLSSIDVKEMEKIFGKYSKYMRLEYINYIWFLSYNNLLFNVFISKRGCSIEICEDSYEKLRDGDYNKDIIEFLTELYDKINES